MKSPTVFTNCVFIWQTVLMTTNMAHLINGNGIVFNYVDTYCSFMLGCSYFASPDYLVVKVWIKVMVLFTLFLNPKGTNICISVKIVFWCSWVLGSR